MINNIVRGTERTATRSGADHRVRGRGQGRGEYRDRLGERLDPIDVDPFDAEVTHNLCFNNSGVCPAGRQPERKPKFVDVVDYNRRRFPRHRRRPAGRWTGRPRPHPQRHGRARRTLDIAQYDIQRDPESLAPYVCPLFKASADLSGGVLEVKAEAWLGCADRRGGDHDNRATGSPPRWRFSY